MLQMKHMMNTNREGKIIVFFTSTTGTDYNKKKKNTKIGGSGQPKIETMNEREKRIVDVVLHRWTE
jgi:hypothetical protein